MRLCEDTKWFLSLTRVVWFLLQLDAASQQQLGSMLTSQQEVLKNLNELR